MTRLDESFATLRTLGATYAGSMVLVRWADTERGRTATFRLDDGPDADAVHPFKGLPAHPKDGQRFKALLIMVGDVAEEPEAEVIAEPVSCAPAVPLAGVGTSPVPPSADEKVRRKLREMPYPQRAGMLVSDELFWRYLGELWGYKIHSATQCDEVLKGHLHIQSKTELATNIDAAERFQDIEDGYRTYRATGEYARAEA